MLLIIMQLHVAYVLSLQQLLLSYMYMYKYTSFENIDLVIIGAPLSIVYNPFHPLSAICALNYM